MLHFHELLDRENDYQHEYEKLEEMIYHEIIPSEYECLYTLIEKDFRKWNNRKNYISFDEMRKALGFDNGSAKKFHYVENIDIERYIVYCEMVSNIIWGLWDYFSEDTKDKIKEILDTMGVTLAKAGLERQFINDDWIVIVQKNAAAVLAASENPALADIIIEYNHYLLKGQLERKREILFKITHALEPHRSELAALNKQLVNDFFGLSNNANIRHNNVTPEYKDYNSTFANMTNDEKEEIYDLMYDQALALFVLLGQPERDKKCRSFLSTGSA